MTWMRTDAPEPRYQVCVLHTITPELVRDSGHNMTDDLDGHFDDLEQAKEFAQRMHSIGWKIMLFDTVEHCRVSFRAL